MSIELSETMILAKQMNKKSETSRSSPTIYKIVKDSKR